MAKALSRAEESLADVGAEPSASALVECVADKGYQSRAVLKGLDGGVWKSRIAEPRREEFFRWRGDAAARKAVYGNRARLRSGVGRAAMRKRAEIVERGFAHILDRGGMRRAWLRGRESIHKRYLLHVAGHNLGLLMRHLFGVGTPRQAWARGWGICVIFLFGNDALCLLIVAPNPLTIAIIGIGAPNPYRS